MICFASIVLFEPKSTNEFLLVLCLFKQVSTKKDYLQNKDISNFEIMNDAYQTYTCLSLETLIQSCIEIEKNVNLEIDGQKIWI